MRLKHRDAKILEQERRIKEQEEIIAKYERKLRQNWDRRRPIEVGKELEWFIGTVLSVDLKANEFQVSYEGESDVCCFTLLDDIVHV